MSQTNDTPGIYFYTESKTDGAPPEEMKFTGVMTGFGRGRATDIGISITLFGSDRSFGVHVFDFLKTLMGKPGAIEIVLGKRSYRIENRTQRLARLGVELAGLRQHEHDTPRTVEEINRLNDRMDAVMVEILQVAERWPVSNE